MTSQKTLRRRQRNKILGWSASVSLYISLRSCREAVLYAGVMDALALGSVWNPCILWTLLVVIILEINTYQALLPFQNTTTAPKSKIKCNELSKKNIFLFIFVNFFRDFVNNKTECKVFHKLCYSSLQSTPVKSLKWIRWKIKATFDETRLTYSCAHLRWTKESLTFAYDIWWYWVSRRRYWLVLGGSGSV